MEPVRIKDILVHSEKLQDSLNKYFLFLAFWVLFKFIFRFTMEKYDGPDDSYNISSFSTPLFSN